MTKASRCANPLAPLRVMIALLSSAASRSKRGVATALLAAAPLIVLALACGGTTGREGLPIAAVDSGTDATVLDASLPPEATPDARVFDVEILYADRVLPDVQVPDSGSDAPEVVKEGGLAPCTTAAGLTALDGGPNCVFCQGNASKICTPTEAQFVQYDIDHNNITQPGPDIDGDAGLTDYSNQPCYQCLLAGSCLDDSHGDTGNECEDTTDAAAYAPITFSAMETTATQCEAVITCILGSGVGPKQCDANSVGTCYCGTASNSACASGNFSQPMTAGINGVCAAQIAAGLGLPQGDGADIAPNFNATTTAGGRANQMFTCANSNDCLLCQ
jgi:hypothetical protein